MGGTKRFSISCATAVFIFRIAGLLYLWRFKRLNDEKYIGLDVHQPTISVAVMDSSGKLIMEYILETKAAAVLDMNPSAKIRRFTQVF